MKRYISRVASTVRERLSKSARLHLQAKLHEEEVRARLKAKLAALRDQPSDVRAARDDVWEATSETCPFGEFIVMASHGIQTVQRWHPDDAEWLAA
jgi:hypothetical protein